MNSIRFPKMQLLIDFDNLGFGQIESWHDVTDYVLSVSGDKEEEGERLGSVTSDIVTFTVDNSERFFSKDNINGPFYGKIKSNTKFVLKAGEEGQTLNIYALGYITDFTPKWKSGEYLIKTTDPFNLFKKTEAPKSSYQDISWDQLVNILCDEVGLPTTITRDIPKTEFYYTYFKFEEDNCFDALKKLIELSAGKAYFDQDKFVVKSKLALDYQLNTTEKETLTVDDIYEIEEDVSKDQIINAVTIKSDYKNIAPLQVVWETPDNITKVENEQITWDGSNFIYVDSKNLPLINDEDNPISIQDITQGRTVYINSHNTLTGEIEIHPDSLTYMELNDILSVSYSYQQLALVSGAERVWEVNFDEEVDSINDLDAAVWDEDGKEKLVYSETPDTVDTVSLQGLSFDQTKNIATITLKNNYSNPITISTLQLRGYPIKVINPVEVYNKDLPSIDKYQRQELPITNNYINNANLAQKLSQYIVDNNSEHRKNISISVDGYVNRYLGDVIKVTENKSGTDHKFTIQGIGYEFSIGDGWTSKLNLLEIDSVQWTYTSFSGESWEKTNRGTPNKEFIEYINANLIKNGGAELYTGIADYDDIGAVDQKHIVPDYWTFTRNSGDASARIRDGGNLVLHGQHSFEITTTNSGSGALNQIVNGVKPSETHVLTFEANAIDCTGKAHVKQYDSTSTLLQTNTIDISSRDNYELTITSLSTTSSIVVELEKVAGTVGVESIVFDKIKFEQSKYASPYIENEETSAVQINVRYANSLTIGNNYGVEVYDQNENIKVRIGQYDPGVYGLKIWGGAIEIVDGLPENQINSTSVGVWNKADNINSDGTFSTNKLSGDISIATNNINADSNFYWSTSGLIAVDPNDTNNIVKLTSGGLGISSDGGISYNNAITGSGVVATKLSVTDGGTTLLEGHKNSYGGSLSLNDINGWLNVRIGSESGVGDNVGGTIALYNDGSKRAAWGIDSSYDAGVMNLLDTSGVARVSLSADSNSGPYMGVASSTGTMVTYFTQTNGYINGNSVLTTSSYLSADDLDGFAYSDFWRKTESVNADTVDDKHASDFATASHTHSEYASSSHNHDGRYVKHYYSGDDIEMYVNDSNQLVVYKNGSYVGKTQL